MSTTIVSHLSRFGIHGGTVLEKAHTIPQLAKDVTEIANVPFTSPVVETVQPGFTALDSLEAAWVDPGTKSVHKIRTERGVCVVPTLAGAPLS